MLSKLLNVQIESKSKVIYRFWLYVRVSIIVSLLSLMEHEKQQQLQSQEEKNVINANAELKQLFNLDKIPIVDIPKLLDRHLNPLDPIEIHYPIK